MKIFLNLTRPIKTALKYSKKELAKHKRLPHTNSSFKCGYLKFLLGSTKINTILAIVNNNKNNPLISKRNFIPIRILLFCLLIFFLSLATKNIIGLGIGYVIAIWNAALIGSILLKKYLRESKCQYADSEYEKTIKWSIFKYAMPIFIVSIGSLL